jgi:hypothetical protein
MNGLALRFVCSITESSARRPWAWLDAHAGAIQAVSAVVVAILTGLLVWFTLKYVRVADDALALTRDQLHIIREQVAQEKSALDISLEQFTREWRPHLTIARIDHLNNSSVTARVANLARPSALITELVIEQRGHGGGPESRTYSKAELVPGGEVGDISIYSELLLYRREQSPFTSGVPTWQASLRAKFTYDCGFIEQLATNWRDFSVTFRGTDIVALGP